MLCPIWVKIFFNLLIDFDKLIQREINKIYWFYNRIHIVQNPSQAKICVLIRSMIFSIVKIEQLINHKKLILLQTTIISQKRYKKCKRFYSSIGAKPEAAYFYIYILG